MAKNSDYQVWFINPANDEPILYVDQSQFTQLRYDKILNNIGSCTIQMPYDGIDLIELLPFDTIIQIKRKLPDETAFSNEDFYILRNVTRTRNGDNEFFIFGGLSAAYLLGGRIIYPDDDPLVAGGYSTKDGAADDVIRAYVREQAGDLASANRQIPDFTVAATGSIGKLIGRRLRYENLWKIVDEIAKAGQVDFWFDRLEDGTGAIEMSVGRLGTDKTYKTTTPLPPYTILSPDRGNLSDPSIYIDKSNEETTMYVLSEGENTNRRLIIVESGTQNATIYSRREAKLESRQNDRNSVTDLITNALAQIEKQSIKEEFSFDIVQGAGGAEYGVDLFLGDKITIVWDSIRKDVRVSKIVVDINAGAESIKIEVSDNASYD